MSINESATVIGDSVQVRGNLTGDEDLHVLGRIEGSIDLQRTLVVAESSNRDFFGHRNQERLTRQILSNRI